MKQIEVTILGQSYRLACPDDGEATLLSAVSAVDREMGAIRDAGKVKARERIAVLAALNLAFQLSERSAAAAGERPAVPPPAPSSPPAEADAARIRALIDRIEAAIGSDGHLL